ncbi:hypothetical protein JCM11641_007884 [Rhodosporidiobolus odoratus]
MFSSSQPPPPQPHPQQPIQQRGFNVPLSHPANSSSTFSPHPSFPTSLPQSASAIDPTVLLGLTSSVSSGGSGAGSNGVGNGGGFGPLQQAAGSAQGTTGTYGSYINDADLDFESMLASLGPSAAGLHGTASAGASGGYPPQPGYPALQPPTHPQHYAQQQQGSPHIGSQGPFYGGAGSNGFLGSAPQFSSFPHAQPHPAVSSPHIPQHPSRFTTSPLPPTFYRRPSSDLFSRPASANFGSPSLPSSSFSSAPLTDSPGPAAANKLSPRGTGPCPSSGGAGERQGRSATSGSQSQVGKAPRQTSRSRSARRNSSAAGYQDRPSPSSGAGGGGGTGPSTGEKRSSSRSRALEREKEGNHAAQAIVIPSSSASTSSTSAGLLAQQHHPYASSLPAYPPLPSTTGTPSSFNSTSSFFPPIPHNPSSSSLGYHSQGSSTPIPLSGSAGAAGGGKVDASGWKPNGGGSGQVVPASAPPATGSGRKKSLADVQEEEAGEERGSLDPATEKRRKRRESHNLVERRRRDNINDRIQELSDLLPEAFLNGGPPELPQSLAGLGLGERIEREGRMGEGEVASPSAGLGGLSLKSPAMGGPRELQMDSGSPTSQVHELDGGRGKVSAASQAQAQPGKPNKGMVLAKSVEYIQYLFTLLTQQSHQSAELQRQNAVLRAALAHASSSHSDLHTKPPTFPFHLSSSPPTSAFSISQKDPYTNLQPPTIPLPSRAANAVASRASPASSSSLHVPSPQYSSSVSGGAGTALGLHLGGAAAGTGLVRGEAGTPDLGGAGAFFDFEGAARKDEEQEKNGERAWTPMEMKEEE